MIRKTFRSVRLSIVREPVEQSYAMTAVRSGGDVAGLVRAVIADDPRERFLGIYLDGRHRVIGVHSVSVGTVDSAPVHPREVFQPAVLLGASALVIAHNHPSGDATPSIQDRQVTERIKQAGELMGVECLDHVVVGVDRFYSFAEESFHPMPCQGVP